MINYDEDIQNENLMRNLRLIANSENSSLEQKKQALTLLVKFVQNNEIR